MGPVYVGWRGVTGLDYRRCTLQTVALAVAVCLGWAVSAGNSAFAADVERRPSPARAVMLADGLAAHGRLYSDATILMAAARMLRRAGFGYDDPALGDLSPEALHAEAAELDAVIARQAGLGLDLRSRKRGVVQGAIVRQETLAPGETAQFNGYVFAPAEYADVTIRLIDGDAGNGDVDLYIRNVNGDLVAQDAKATTGIAGVAAYAAWTPQKCAKATIEVANRTQTNIAFMLAAAPSRQSAWVCKDAK